MCQDLPGEQIGIAFALVFAAAFSTVLGSLVVLFTPLHSPVALGGALALSGESQPASVILLFDFPSSESSQLP
jgi:hypothetical protein